VPRGITTNEIKRRGWMRVITLAAAVAAVFCMAVAASASAASPNGQTVTITEHQHGTWTEEGDTDFCTGETVTPTITGNAVNHVTVFTGSDEVWGTFTEEGTVVGVIGDLTYTGRITVWGNFNVNERNSNNTFTTSVKLSATDEQGVVHTEVGHEVAHISFNALDPVHPVVSFDKMYFTCT
jgi:opacity protein-like surface antigen